MCHVPELVECTLAMALLAMAFSCHACFLQDSSKPLIRLTGLESTSFPKILCVYWPVMGSVNWTLMANVSDLFFILLFDVEKVPIKICFGYLGTAEFV